MKCLSYWETDFNVCNLSHPGFVYVNLGQNWMTNTPETKSLELNMTEMWLDGILLGLVVIDYENREHRASIIKKRDNMDNGGIQTNMSWGKVKYNVMW